MTARALFCRQVRARSKDNDKAIQLLHSQDLLGKVVSTLREELDSLVRIIYLLSIADRQRRTELMQASAEGRKWTVAGSRMVITDRDMVELAQRLHGWTESVYRFGCAFIHLSRFHDYRERDPMAQISTEERLAILGHMRAYHGGPSADDATFQDLRPYLPMVFAKIRDNLECYLKNLEADGDLASA